MKRIIICLLIILTVFSSFMLTGCNNETKVIQIDTDKIKREHLEQMSEEGAYMITDGTQTVVTFVNPVGYEYDSNFELLGGEIIFYYSKDELDNDFERIDDDAYLIKNHHENYGDDSTIKIFIDGKEASFKNVIVSDDIFK